MHKRAWNCVREWVYKCTCSHGVSALQMTGPVTDRAVWWEQSLSREQGCAGVHCFVCLYSSPAARLAMPGKGSAAPTHATGTRRRGQHTHLCFHESLPGTQVQGTQLLLLSLVSLSRGNALMSSATSLSSGKGLGARLRARLEPPSQADAQALCGFCARAESGRQLWGSSDSIPLLLPAYTGAVGMLDPTSSSSVKTALNYLSRIVSTTRVVLIIECNLWVPPGL